MKKVLEEYAKIKEELTDIDMVLIIDKSSRRIYKRKRGICYTIHQYTYASNKYMKDYDKNRLWQVSSKYFIWIEDNSQFNEDFIKKYNEESDEKCSLEVGFQYSEKLHELHNDLPFLSERITFYQKEWLIFQKVEKLVTNLHDKTEYVIYVRNLKQALNDQSILKKVYRVIENWKQSKPFRKKMKLM